jgi:hypothetical protein
MIFQVRIRSIIRIVISRYHPAGSRRWRKWHAAGAIPTSRLTRCARSTRETHGTHAFSQRGNTVLHRLAERTGADVLSAIRELRPKTVRKFVNHVNHVRARAAGCLRGS